MLSSLSLRHLAALILGCLVSLPYSLPCFCFDLILLASMTLIARMLARLETVGWILGCSFWSLRYSPRLFCSMGRCLLDTPFCLDQPENPKVEARLHGFGKNICDQEGEGSSYSIFPRGSTTSLSNFLRLSWLDTWTMPLTKSNTRDQWRTHQ